MKVSNPFLRFAIGAKVTPDFPNLAGDTHVGIEVSSRPTTTAGVLSARIVFSAVGQTALFNAATGGISLSATGTRQVETATVTGTGGGTVTGAYSLLVTVAGNKIAGGPLVVSIPTHLGQTMPQVAAAIAAELQRLPAITEFYTVAANNASVSLTSIYGFANETNLNMAWSGVSDITPVVTSANTVAGALGVLLVRPGSSTGDIFGAAWKGGVITHIVATVSTPSSFGGLATFGSLPSVASAETAAKIINPALAMTSETVTSNFTGGGIVDLVAFCAP